MRHCFIIEANGLPAISAWREAFALARRCSRREGPNEVDVLAPNLLPIVDLDLRLTPALFIVVEWGGQLDRRDPVTEMRNKAEKRKPREYADDRSIGTMQTVCNDERAC
jgi:hypothetical protein